MELGSRSDFPAMRIPVLLVFLAVTAPPGVEAQETARVPFVEPPRHTIEATRITTIGSADGPDLLEYHPVTVAIDSRGRYYLTTALALHEVKVFDSSGRFLRLIGREGEGPGEFGRISNLVVGPRDSLYVLDDGNSRLTVVSREHDMIRTAPLPFGADYPRVHYLRNDVLLVNANVRTPEVVGLPLHTVTTNGEHLFSFGSSDPVYRPDFPQILRRRTTLSRDGTIWSAYPKQYVLERWTLSGRFVERLIVEAEWFEPYMRTRYPTPDESGFPNMQSIYEDGAGRIWCAVVVPDENWAEGLGEPRVFEGQRYYEVEDLAATYDTRVDVIDLRTRQVLASLILDGYPIQFLSDGKLITYREPGGVPLVDVWRSRIRSLQPRRER